VVVHACTDRRCALQAKERSRLEAQLAEAEQRLAAAQRERKEEEARLNAATDSVEGARLAQKRFRWCPARGLPTIAQD
jgi:septal ring factor EnvC (AmiA/AmiB activator)